MRDLYFLTGMLVGAGVGMVIAAKNSQVKKFVEAGEKRAMEAIEVCKDSICEDMRKSETKTHTANNATQTQSKPKQTKSN